MKKNLTVFLLLLSLKATACLNEISVIPGITYPNQLNGWELWKPMIDRHALNDYIARSRVACVENVSCSDLVIAYLYAGQTAAALELSTRLVKKFPQRYEVVMTHAGALELNGRYREALSFIHRGMRIDPASHKNSEWIHVKILEARIAGGDPSTILGLEFGKEDEPDTPKGIENVRQMVDQIHFQLTERYYFIPKNDRQFGALLHDYANLLYLSNFKTVSREYYDLAAKFGYDPALRPNSTSLPPLPKIQQTERPPYLHEQPKRPEPSRGWSFRRKAVIIAGTFVVLAGFLLFRNRRKRK